MVNALNKFFFIYIFTGSFVPSENLSSTRHTVAAIPGDLVLGALFPVHHAPGPKQAQTRTCGSIREQYGIQRIEAAFQTIDQINSDSSILPEITLGIEIRDSCWYSPIALEQSIEFIRDAMAASDEKSENNLDIERPLESKISHSPLFPWLNSPFPIVNPLNYSTCQKHIKKIKNLVGVIGPASSSVTIQVQNLLQLFNIPQIGYSATSKDLSTKNHYMYFLRVVPSDELQAKVMVDLIRANNWTYISALYTDGNYGSSLMEVFKSFSQDAGICIANTETVNNNAEDDEFDEIVRSLQQYKNAKVVACFCEGMTVRGVLKAIRRLNATGELLLVGSDGWSDRYDVVEGYEQEAVGGISVRIHSPYVHSFDPYYFSLHPDNNTRNPWFREFWEFKFNCSLPNEKGKTRLTNFNRTCTGKESLAEKYKQDTKLAFVIKAIWTMAYGLHAMQLSLCPNTTGWCPAMLPVNGSLFLNHLLNVSFEWTNETVYFNEYGDPPGRYDIMNFQKTDKGYDYSMVGSWDSNSNQLHTWKSFQWPTGLDSDGVPESVCSKPCKKGEAKNIQSDSVKCCWVCVPCRLNEYLRDEYNCEMCPKGWWPNENQTACDQLTIEFIKWTETSSLLAIGIAIIGFLLTFFTMLVFIKHNDTPVVKSSTRELSYMILIGMYLAYGTTFALIAKPTKHTCFVTRVLPGFSFAVIYASLVTKTNRIDRILSGSKKRIITKKPRFMSSTAQVVITCLLIIAECIIITVVLIREPADSKLDYPTLGSVILICNTTTLGIAAPLGFDFLLIAMCTWYAFKTRNVPANFNEAKFIGFTMYTTLVIWIAFIPIYFGTELKVLTMCLCVSFSALVALILLFFPKLYIILFNPEKNHRSYFTTAKNVRCHIGYVPTLGISKHSSHSASDFNDSPRNYSFEGKSLHFNQPLKRNIFDKSAQSSGLVSEKSSLGTFKAEPHRRFNLLERLRINKKDKIAANVQRKILAVRKAEQLDRETNRRGIGRTPRRQSSSLGFEYPPSSIKPRLISMLKQTYGDDLYKIPGFAEFESKDEAKTPPTTEAFAQTSYDLLEAWFPALRQRFPKEANKHNDINDFSSSSAGGIVVNSRSGHMGSSTLINGVRTISTGSYSGIYNTAMSSVCQRYSANGIYSSPMGHALEDKKLQGKTEYPWLSSYSDDHMKIKEKTEKDYGVLHDNVGTQTPRLTRVRASSESLLSASGSCVIEESASSGGESSPSSGVVYKNIIISLGSDHGNRSSFEKDREYRK